MDKSAVVMPARTEINIAIKQLQQIRDREKKAGDDTKECIEVGKTGVESFHSSVANLMKAQMSMGGTTTTANAISSEFNRAADYCKHLAMEFGDLRQAFQQIATLKGQSNSNKVAVNKAKKAAANLALTEWKSFQEQFQCYGGASLERDQAQFKDRESISANEQAPQYQQRIIQFAKSRGVSTAEIAQLGGTLLQFSEGPQTVDDLLGKMDKVYKTLERAPTSTSTMTPQMSLIVAQGGGPEDGSRMFAVMSEATLYEPETGVTNTRKAPNAQMLKGKGSLVDQMENVILLQQSQAAAKSINDCLHKREKVKAILADIALDMRKTEGLKGLFTRGFEAEGFERTEAYERNSPADFIQHTLIDCEAIGAIQKEKRDVTNASAKTQVGAKYHTVEAALQLANTRVIETDQLQERRLPKLDHDVLSLWSVVDKEQQKIKTQAIGGLHETHTRLSLTDLKFVGSDVGNTFAQRDQVHYSMNIEIRDLLKKIDEKTSKNPALTALPVGYFGLRQAGGG